MEECKEVLSIPNIQLWIKWGSKFDSKLPLVKAQYDFGSVLDTELFVKLLVNERATWDDNLMESMEVENLSPEISVIHYVVKPPVFFMKPRDFAEKKIRFSIDETYYGYHGSIPDAAFPYVERYQRCETVFSGNILRKENDSYIYYTFSQLNLNVIFVFIIDG